MTKFNSINWEKNYVETISACVDDTISALLLLIYQQYLTNNNPIQYNKLTSLDDF